MANKTKHTPGPWRIEGRHLVADVSDLGTVPHTVIRDDSERWVALVETVDREGWANARLIAAAPEMYEALHLAELVMARGDGLSYRDRKDAHDVVLKALAKARGEKA